MNRMIRQLGLALLLSTGSAWALPQLNISVPPYDLYYVGDLDPRGTLGGVADEISINLTNVEPGPYHLVAGLWFGDHWLVRGTITGVVLNGGDFHWNLGNIREGLDDGVFHSSAGEFNENFLDQISGNALPSGTYELRLEFAQPETGRVSQFFSFFDPRQVDVQLPFDGARVHTDQPAFSWSGRASRYVLRVCEFNPERHGSPEEAIHGDPMWEAELLGQTSVVYGQGGGPARPLVDGGRYVWVVEALLSTTSGDQRFAGPLRSFVVGLDEGGGGDQPDMGQLLDFLTPGQLAAVAALLEGYELGGTILVDGRPVSLEEFQDLLRRLGSGELNLASIRVE